MAAPTFVGASTGVVLTGASGAVACDVAGLALGDFVILQLLSDSTSGGWSPDSWSGISRLDGLANAGTVLLLNSPVGSPTAAFQGIWVGFVASLSSPSVAISTAGSEDVYGRIYAFRGVNTGTTLLTVMENNGTEGTLIQAGAARQSAGTAAAIADQQVTTTGADRLACQFVAVDDDNPVGSFTGMTGGTWAEAVAEFASATGTDGCIQLQTATIASAGTINGGSFTMAASDSWGVIGFALLPPASAVGSLLPQRSPLQAATLTRM